MLSRLNRLTRGVEYRAVVRGGRRCGGSHTVTYVMGPVGDRAPRFGFIVSKQVGGAVVRNTVRRRLKAVCAEVVDDVASGADIVIRALPSAATAPYDQLRGDVRRCLAKRAAA
ncbi:ribonuclease P protein component [Microbacterium sp. zg.Y1090]|uniref:ribonuclease P protein component n=1 Tax=Microbacterium TaxID=33882 RepID=UPI00214BDD2E|nr:MULTISPECIES: ribonuclease P protein component [unclassified Microbacterium]MCR2813004.1 ribonuclease P protein component [Microbacterium sp. zg.Y1084]MCR2819337.1 ribonuclease P protein component [Microbacterium sp. zg.Y1090]MDL5487254.1 ribonuclease P protein component [Microbacterium sp. zg-Y1211]WIM28318.1 ribonuclease P protein component [Microbacterium sp. zg-Y1090]